MKLFTFGDSYTEGVGCDLTKENKILDDSEKTLFRNKHAWPSHLSNLLQIPHINYGIGGASNKVIFDTISTCLKENLISNGDFVVVMWSSSLRDDVPYFPNEEWHIWSNRYKQKKHIFHSLINKKHSNNPTYNSALASYKLFFIENIFSNVYYNYVNQNYILYVQHMFEEMGIRYMFCDAFDIMIPYDIDSNIDSTSFINKKNYWGFRENTIKDYLILLDAGDVWEDFIPWGETLGKHPNKFGYELIAKELYRFIVDNDILNTPIKIKNKII